MAFNPYHSPRKMQAPRLRPEWLAEDSDPSIIGDWLVGRTLGKGGSGLVRMAQHMKTHQYGAVKILSKHSLPSDDVQKAMLRMEREIVVMKLIDHPNVLKLHDVWETNSELFLIVEYLKHGNLSQHVPPDGLPIPVALHYFQQIVHGVSYFHMFNIAHRDLKPENILLGSRDEVKIADFGMAAWQRDDVLLQTSCGSPHYASPEVVNGSSYCGAISDVWSCGVILFFMLTGSPPFDSIDTNVVVELVSKGAFEMPPQLPIEGQDLILRMLEVDVTRRITMAEIQTHPFFLSGPGPSAGIAPAPPTFEEIGDLVQSELDIDPEIFRNLKTLWYDVASEQIKENLLAPGPAWEKMVYFLLLKYRAGAIQDCDASEASSFEHEEIPGSPPAFVAQEDEFVLADSPFLADMSFRNRSAMASRVSSASSRLDPTFSHPSRPNAPTPRKSRTMPLSVRIQDSTTSVRTRSSADLGSLSSASSDFTILTSWPARNVDLAPKESSTSAYQNGDPIESMSPALPSSLQLSDLRNVDDTIVQDLCGRLMNRLLIVQSPVLDSNKPGFLDTYPNEDDRNCFPFGSPSVDAPLRSGSDGFQTTLPLQLNQHHKRRSLTSRIKPLGLGAINSQQRKAGGPARNDFDSPSLTIDAYPTAPPFRPRAFTQNDVLRPSGKESNRIGITRRKTTDGSGTQEARAKTSHQNEKENRNPPIEKVGARLRKRGPISPILGGARWEAPAYGKKGWFGNVFNLNQPTHQVLSVYDVHTTMQECRNTLEAVGITVIEGTANGAMHVVRCKHDKTRGVTGATKSVRFRVDIHPSTAASSLSLGHITTVSFTQEGGSTSLFKEIFALLRDGWKIDIPSGASSLEVSNPGNPLAI